MKPRILLFLLLAAAALAAPARSVIVMVPDGCDHSLVTLARWYAGRPLALDPVLTGAVCTHSHASAITGSAAAAAAFSTGYKTSIGFLGTGPAPEPGLDGSLPPETLCYRPLATVLEAARLAGKATGLVATSTVSHATPAAFAAHVTDRNLNYDIMRQLACADLDVVFGGGRRYLLSEADGGRRRGGPDLRALIESRGGRVFGRTESLPVVKTTPAWGLFADRHLAPELDRVALGCDEPALARMTEKAIALLARDPDGFFLLVEGSQVDWACHANDPAQAVTDFLAFDDAVRVALDFARRDSHTLVLAFPDHDCGGLSIGSDEMAGDYRETALADLLEPLRRMRLSADGITALLGDCRAPDSIRALVRDWWGAEPADAEIEEMVEKEAGGLDFDYALSEVFCRNHTTIGWTTHGHTGDDVPLWAWGPSAPAGLLDNTELARVAAGALGLDLRAASAELFVDVEAELGTFSVDSSERYSPVLVIKGARLPVGTDLLVVGADTSELPGVSLWYRETGRAWVPRAAVELLRAPR